MENANPSSSTSNNEFLDPKKKIEIESWLEDSRIIDSLVGSDEIEYFDTFPTLEELEYHEWLLKYPKPSWRKIPPAVAFRTSWVISLRPWNSDCETESQSDNTVGSPHGFIIHWVIISKNIKEVAEVIDVKNWRIDNSRVLRRIVYLIEWNSSVSTTKSSIQSMPRFR
ncbi:hypothetical protein Tco_1272905 [Tanacetum coccineum]